jgi:drug/metabolite transporter (DMT)-like permease
VGEFLLLMVIVFLGTGGELCITRALRTHGEVMSFHPRVILRFLAHAMRSGWTWIGVAMMTVAFFALLAMLSVENVSFVVPVTALNYAVGAGGGALFLHERVSKRRWIGVAVVCIGVIVVWLGKR